MTATTRLLSYDELAALLRIGPESARNLVRRKRWGRQPGNDGRMRVLVPLEVIEAHPPADGPTDGPTDGAANRAADGPADGAAVSALERHIARLESELAAVKSERDADRAMALSVAGSMAGLEAQISSLQTLLAEMREDRAAWRAQAERLAVQTSRRSWWKRLAG